MRAKLAYVALLTPALLAFATTAPAKPVPVASQPVVIIAEDFPLYTGPAGAMLEVDYFRAPQPAFAAGRVFPCRLKLRMFDKTRLAQSCN